MLRQQTVANLKWFIICTTLTSVSSVTLSPSTQKSRHTKYNFSSPAPAIASFHTPAEGVALYEGKTNYGTTCILLETDGVIEVDFQSTIDDEKADTYMPEKPTIDVNCLYEDTATMTISWNGYSLFWAFAKTPGGDRWYVDKLELTVSKLLGPYHNMKKHISGDTFKLVHSQMLFPTPVGKSYICEESIVKLFPHNSDSSSKELLGTLFLRKFQLQPFIFKGSNFGPPFECNAQLGFRDETAPIAVGSTLAIAVLMTVTGYGIFRYFKIKKVQYNTME